MSTFDNLPTQKKDRIINAAADFFSAHGYQKTSVSDIARAAGISKAMVFTYFGSKLGCYEYLCNTVMDFSLQKFEKFKDRLLVVSDYFDRMILLASIKMEISKSYPSFLTFGVSMVRERDPAVRPIVDSIMAKAQQLYTLIATKDIDPHKFKDPADAARVSRMLEWISNGCASEWVSCGGGDALDGILKSYNDCLLALKKHFYKEEYQQCP